jgi:hypothetical protein
MRLWRPQYPLPVGLNPLRVLVRSELGGRESGL